MTAAVRYDLTAPVVQLVCRCGGATEDVQLRPADGVIGVVAAAGRCPACGQRLRAALTYEEQRAAIRRALARGAADASGAVDVVHVLFPE